MRKTVDLRNEIAGIREVGGILSHIVIGERRPQDAQERSGKRPAWVHFHVAFFVY